MANSQIVNDIEIMAPVGCWESLAAALEAGATSVYFGIEYLNMRSRSSANFTTADLHTIVERCQAAGVKTYLTLNTVMYPEDLPLMQEIVDHAKLAGVSAIMADKFVILNFVPLQHTCFLAAKSAKLFAKSLLKPIADTHNHTSV